VISKNQTPSSAQLFQETGMNQLRILAAAILCMVLSATSALADKPRLAIQDLVATDAVVSQAKAQSQHSVLEQILQGSDTQLANMINQTSRFDIVARSKYRTILREQGIADSGDVNPSDPQTARAFQMAGAQFVATLTVDNYQDITTTASFKGGFGTSKAERRTIQIQATLQIFDTTTAVMLESASVTIEESTTNEIMAGATENGRVTNALIGQVTKDIATKTSRIILDALVPAKVIGYTMGNITFNRGIGTGVEKGQIWQVFYPGEEMFDPDTGESYGAEEIPLGWARITSVQPKFSKAQAIQDFGIDRGSIMRLAPDGLPRDVDPDAKATGSSTKSTRSEPGVRSPSRQPVQEPSRITHDHPVEHTTHQPIHQPATHDHENTHPVKLALFIRDVAPDVPDSKALVLENYITSWLTDHQIQVINRAEVLNAASTLASEGTNDGTNDQMNTIAQRLLSDHSSAAAIAQNLGADGLVIATITSLVEDKRSIRDPQRGNYDNSFYTLDVAWNVVDGGSGSSIASGLEQAHHALRQTATLTRTFNIDPMLRDSAMQVGQSIRSKMTRAKARITKAEDNLATINIQITLADLSIPEIRKNDQGEYIVTKNNHDLEATECNVLIDGMLAGTAPGPIQTTAGPHRIRIERPMIDPIDRFMVVRDGMDLNLAVGLSVQGRAQWREQAAFFESLKDGAMLRDADLEHAMAFGQFLRNSKVNLDTSNVRSIGTNTNDFWGSILNVKDNIHEMRQIENESD
tara:strand:+ start:190688 stop:192940 length:2253 start_codon:yes stop_codon:yes gene_type:complete